MNKWIKKSIELANSKGYLDQLFEIYPVLDNSRRTLDQKIKKEIRSAMNQRRYRPLLNVLLRSEIFPIKHSYVAFLKAYPEALKLNPRIVAQIGRRVKQLSLRKVYREMERPIESNRQMGQMFRRWIRKQGYAFVDQKKFLNHTKNPIFLDGNDKSLKIFCNKYLGMGLKKGPDIVLKIKRSYFVGEAKFVTATGGHQGGGISDAMRLLHGKKGRATRLAVYDGVIWLDRKIFKKEKNIALSALLLKKFIKDPKRES